jgi:hypothetical protein
VWVYYGTIAPFLTQSTDRELHSIAVGINFVLSFVNRGFYLIPDYMYYVTSEGVLQTTYVVYVVIIYLTTMLQAQTIIVLSDGLIYL